MRASLASAWRTLAVTVALATYGKNYSLAQSSTQQNASCSRTVQLTVNGTSSLDILYFSLLEAGECGTSSEPSISVEWDGTVEIDHPIIVPDGVELRVQGGGYVYGTDDIISLSSSGSDDGGSTSIGASVVRGNGSVHLFTVEPNGKLYIFGMTLQNGWGGVDGGGGIFANAGATVISESCLWDSLSTFGYGGGAIAAIDVANLTLRGTNIFSGCSSNSSDSNGGAIHLDGTALTMQGDVRFENCSASGMGGGLYMDSLSRLTVEEAASLSFSGCTAGSQAGDNGGGMCSYGSNMTVGSNAKVSFKNNSVSAEGDGGGLYAKSTSITVNNRSNISFINNYAGDDGGGMYLTGMDSDDYSGEDDMTPCFTLAEGTNAIFIGNSGGESSAYGGGVHFAIGCDVVIKGDVHFEQNSAVRAGAMYLDQSRAVISGTAIFINNTAERWGGAVMVLDSDSGLEFNGAVVAQNNFAGRSGGVLYLENAPLVVAEGGGIRDFGALWEGNYAGYDGGVIAVDGGEFNLEGGIAKSNRAAQRGGVIFATGESVLSWTAGESSDNSAASGGSLYISNSKVNLTDVRFVGDHTSSGAVIFFAGADARAINVSIIAPADLVGDFALQVDSDSVLRAFSCSFEEWSGDDSLIVSEGELVLDACDFSHSSNPILFRALSPAVIRNAILGDTNYASAGNDASTIFGFDAQTCSDLSEDYSCQSNGQENSCLDAEYGMGVLCSAYIVAVTGNKVSLTGVGYPVELVATSASASSSSSSSSSSSVEEIVYYPDLVTHELTLRYSSDGSETSDISNLNSSSWEDEDTVGMGADAVLWELRSSDGSEYGGSPNSNGVFAGVSSDNFSWVAMPTSGVLAENQEVTIRFWGSPPPPQDPTIPSAVYNGEISAAFHLLSRTAEAGSTTMSSAKYYVAIFYYCEAGAFWNGEICVLCIELASAMVDGDESLECDMPGVTLVTLPLAAGYWRGDVNSTNVEPCLLDDACKGGRGIVSSNSTSTQHYSEGDIYCETGYVGPYCAVCAEDFRRLSGYECLDCQSEWGVAARVAFWIAVALTPVLLVSLIMFLFGGTTPFTQLQKKVGRTCGWFKPTGVTQWPVEGTESDTTTEGEDEVEEGAPSRNVARTRGLGVRIRRAIPFQKIKIIIVVWQILTQFSALAEIPYPSSYERFLKMLDVFNFDISWALSAMCLVDEIDFHEKLVILTLAPIILLGALGLSYAGAMRWHRGTGRNAIECRQQAKVRHASAALLVLFLVFSSVSTTIFSTFSCDYVDDFKVYMLRADYSISCDDQGHLFYQVYAGVMIVVYPVGIPLTFAYLLLKHRNKINPPPVVFVGQNPGEVQMETFPKRRYRIANFDEIYREDFSMTGIPASFHKVDRDRNVRERAEAGVREHRASHGIKPNEGGGGGNGGDRISRTQNDVGEQDLFAPASSCSTEVLKKRAQDLDLQPTKFLWEPYVHSVGRDPVHPVMDCHFSLVSHSRDVLSFCPCYERPSLVLAEPRNFYYETVECGRRCLLTGALVFVLPNTAGQMAGACIFAFMTLLAFELMRPHLSQTDAWMYRVGCIVIFFSNFLGLMAKADVSGEDAQSQELFGVLLVCVHAIMIMAIILEGYLAIKLQLLEESASNDHVNVVLGPVTNKESMEIELRRGTFHSDGGMYPEHQGNSTNMDFGQEDRAPLSAPAHDNHSRIHWRPRKDDTRCKIGHHFNHEEPGAVAGLPSVGRSRSISMSLVDRTAMEVHRPQGALKGPLTNLPARNSFVQGDLDILDLASERVIGSPASEKSQSCSQQFASMPGPRGALSSYGGITGGFGDGDVSGDGDVCKGEYSQPDFAVPLERGGDPACSFIDLRQRRCCLL